MFKHFCFIFRIGIWTDFHQNDSIETDLLQDGKIYSLQAEILEAGAVKGLKKV